MGVSKDTYDPDFSTMSLGDHLEELRARLILALVGLFIGVIISLSFGKAIVSFIQLPYNQEMKEYMAKHSPGPNTTDSQGFIVFFSTQLIQSLATDPSAPKIDPNTIAYLQEVYATSRQAWEQSHDHPLPVSPFSIPRLQILAPADAFVGYMKISMISGLILTAPWVFYQIWMFVAAGLYPHERKCIRTAIPFSAGLFILGALFFLFVVAPFALGFFLNFGDLIGVTSNWTFQKYISFVTVLMLVFGIAFQTPIAIFILNRTGLVEIRSLRATRKYVILGIFIVAAMVTPPDVISQVTLAIPLYGLYELGIILCVFFNRRKEGAKTS